MDPKINQLIILVITAIAPKLEYKKNYKINKTELENSEGSKRDLSVGGDN